METHYIKFEIEKISPINNPKMFKHYMKNLEIKNLPKIN